MKTSVIRQRVADFLKQYAPFDALSTPDLLELAGSGRVKFHSSEEFLYQKGDGKSDLIWVVQQGRVEVLDVRGNLETLHDVMGAGDLLGLDGLVGDRRSQYSARSATDVILYGVSAALLESMAARYPSLDRFVKARFSMSEWEGAGKHTWLDEEGPPESYVRARRGRHFYEGGIASVRAPFRCREAVIPMLRSGRDVIRVEGQAGEPVGWLSSAELALFCGYDLARLESELRGAESPAELAPLVKVAQRMVLEGLGGATDIDDCRQMGGCLMRAAVSACIGMAEKEAADAGMSAPGVPFCWVMFGAGARGDVPQAEAPQLAVIYDDSQGELGALECAYFVSVAGLTGHWMHEGGLAGQGKSWPNGAQPGMPLTEWNRLYVETLADPLAHEVYARRELFDLCALRGDAGIVEELKRTTEAGLGKNAMAVGLLANDTMSHVPPLTFFEGLVVELDGARKESFDIDAVLVGPVVDAARVMALSKGRVATASTLLRLESAIEDYPAGEAILRAAGQAFRIGLYYRTLADGSTIYPGKLCKADQILLKTAIVSVGRLLKFTVETFMGEQ